MLKRLQKLINTSQRIVLVSHENPDPDAIGSVLACKIYLKSLNKEIIAYSQDTVPKNCLWLPGARNITHELPKGRFDLLIALDAGNLERTGLAQKTKKFKKIVNIDHHYQGQKFGHLQIIQTQASATTEIIYQILKSLKAKITKPLALCLLCGIVSDTANFQHANTTAHTLQTAANLMKTGVSLHKISRYLQQTQSADVLKIWGRTINRAKVNNKGILKSVVTAQELWQIKALAEDVGGLASVLNTADGIKYTALFIDQGDNKIKVSLRSEKGRGVDVSKIARAYGGGGHKYAAGFTLPGRLAHTKTGWKIVN